jgi:hypothetical protein
MVYASPWFHDAGSLSSFSPREIRAALVGEEAGHFDREYRQVAWSTRDDQGARRRMLDNADRLGAGEDIATVPWQQVRARLGL